MDEAKVKMLFVFENGKAKIDVTQCNGCGLCVGICPFGAISKEEE